jgi:HPr kinase/phosphorylase
MMFAPRGTEMGSMVDILGVGVIIRGESGIGKSESVLASSSAATAWWPTTSPR